MTDIYVETPTQADYDALMRLAEAAGYVWFVGRTTAERESDKNYFNIKKQDTIICLNTKYKKINFGSKDEGYKIEKISNLADIKTIYRFKNEESFDLFHETHDKHLTATSHKNPFAIEYSDGSVLFDYESIYKALAVEYKPQESEDIMPEKVKLPKRLYDALQDYGLPENSNESWPVFTISDLCDYWKENESSMLGTYIDRNADNQWKIIDALRYGYEAEPEPEQLYYVPVIEGNEGSFLNVNILHGELKFNNRNELNVWKTKFTMSEIDAIDPRYKAFAVPVEEVNF